MSFQDAWDALHLRMPSRIPRTEYSASGHWPLIQAVTGIPVRFDSAEPVKREAAMAFERAWDFGLTWNTLTYNEVFQGRCTRMGHAVYADGGVDYDTRQFCPFADENEVYALDLYAEYGAIDLAAETQRYNQNYAAVCAAHPDQVNMTGIYVTMVSGLIELLGWDLLLTALGEDFDAFCAFTDRYAAWIEQYFRALAASDAPVVMIHDDIVWTSGAFAQPEWYRGHIFPAYERLFALLRQAGKKILYTSDGTYTAFIDDIAACGVDGFVLEPTTDMAYIAERYGQTHAFVGNADCRVLTYGDKPAIRREVERCVGIGRDCPGFFMAVGNHIPANVPVDNALYYNEVFTELRNR